MVTGSIYESQSKAPPSKRARLENLDDRIHTNVDTMDDIYSTESSTPAHDVSNQTPVEIAKEAGIENSFIASSGIPGLGLLGRAQSGEQGVTITDAQSGTDASGPSGVNDAGSLDVTTALEAYLGGATKPTPKADAPSDDSTVAASGPLKTKEGVDLELAENNLDSTSSGSNDATTDTISLGGENIGMDIQQPFLEEIVDSNMEDVDPQEAEFEVDSSPIESSSNESDSEESSSSEDSDEEDTYKLLGPEEQARILMEGDGGSDDEGGKGTKGPGQLRTKNEVPEEVIPKPDVTITATMKIEELGAVEGIIESILLIKAKTSGEYKVLESGSVLCLADRSVIGVVSETLGRVQQPLYSVRFTNADEIRAAGCVVGTTVYYSEQHSTYVFTQALKAYKGSDASNIFDEEVVDEEVEFSDDEAEAEHKRRLKQKKNERRGERMQAPGGSSRGGHPLQQQQGAYDASVGISYDDEDEGPYRPLARPVGFADSIGRSEAPLEGRGYAPWPGREHNGAPPSRDFHGRGRGRGRGGRGDGGRGRGDRGRGNDRGRGRGSFPDGRQDERPPHDGYHHAVPQTSTQPPVAPPNTYHPYYQAPQEQYSPQAAYSPPQSHFAPTFPAAPLYRPPAYGGQHAYEHSYAQPPHPQHPPPYPHQHQHAYQHAPAFHAAPVQQSWPSVGSGAATSPGAFVNPAFFGSRAVQPSGEAERAFQEAHEILRTLRGEGGG